MPMSKGVLRGDIQIPRWPFCKPQWDVPSSDPAFFRGFGSHPGDPPQAAIALKASRQGPSWHPTHSPACLPAEDQPVVLGIPNPTCAALPPLFSLFLKYRCW